MKTLLFLITLLGNCQAFSVSYSKPIVLGGADFNTVTYAPDPASYGSTITYTIEMVSGGISGVSVDGSFSNLDINSFADLNPFSQTVNNFYDDNLGGGFIPNGTWNCNASPSSFSCSPNGINGLNPGDLPMGNHLFEITVIVENSLPPALNIFNLDLTTTFGSPRSVPTSIQIKPDNTTLEATLFIAQNPSNPNPTSSFEYAIEVSNVGNNNAEDWSLEISSEMIREYSYFSGPFICTPSNCSISCTYDMNAAGPFEPSDNVSLFLNAVAPENGPFTSSLLLMPGGEDIVDGANPITNQTLLNNDYIFISHFENIASCSP
jgi:hypothetical protein